MVWCIFRTNFLSKDERDNYIPTIENILTSKTFDYKFVNCTFSSQASVEADKFVGDSITRHVSYLNDAFYYIYGYFKIESANEQTISYQCCDLINFTHSYN